MVEGLFQPMHLVLILALVLILFGAGKLPETMAQFGRGIRTFREEADKKTAATPSSVAATPSSVACGSCGTPALVGAKFCASCGKAL